MMCLHRTGDKPLSEPIMAEFTDAYMRPFLVPMAIKQTITIPKDKNLQKNQVVPGPTVTDN